MFTWIFRFLRDVGGAPAIDDGKVNVVLNTSLFYRYGIVRFILVCGHKKGNKKMYEYKISTNKVTVLKISGR